MKGRLMLHHIAAVGFSALLLTVPVICRAQSFADALDVPSVMRSLKFGMSVSDVQHAIPNTKHFGAPAEPTSAMVVEFNAETWNLAQLGFKNGELNTIGLAYSSDAGRDKQFEKAQDLLRKILQRNGDGYTRLVTISPGRPAPVYVWLKSDFVLFAIGPTDVLSAHGKEAFRRFPELIVGVAPKTTPIGDLVTIATQSQLTEILFKLISPFGQ